MFYVTSVKNNNDLVDLGVGGAVLRLFEMAIKVGVVQMRSTFDKISNFQQAAKLITQAKFKGAKVYD